MAGPRSRRKLVGYCAIGRSADASSTFNVGRFVAMVFGHGPRILFPFKSWSLTHPINWIPFDCNIEQKDLFPTSMAFIDNEQPVVLRNT